MSWVKPSLYIIGLLIVVFGGALLLDQTAHMVGMTKWLPDRRQARLRVELQYYEMWMPIVATSQSDSENLRMDANTVTWPKNLN